MKTLGMFRALRLKAMALTAVAWITLAGAETARAEVIDCTYDGYVAMGGMVFNTTNSYLLPSWPDSPPQSGMGTFGYAFLKFDAAALPASAVASATLTLDVITLQDGMSYPATGIGNVGVFAVSADVAGISYGTAGTFRDYIADVATDSVSMTGAGLITLDVTAIVNEWIASGHNYGLILASPGGLMPRLHSSDAVDGLAPFITTTAVPEPATMGLLAAGAVGLLARRRRRRNG